MYVDGQPQTINGIIQNVTPQIQARQSIGESEARFRTIAEQAPVAVLILNGVAANHGGAIVATSRPGQGAAFSVQLPE